MVVPESEQQSSGPLRLLAEWASSVHAFRRNKVPATKKVVAAGLCNSGYSYREVASMMRGMSYVAVRDAYFAIVTSLPREVKRNRREVSIDGADVSIGGKSYHLWLARDVDSGEIMSFQASPRASAEDGARFLSNVASQCENRPILKLGYGANRPRGLLNLDLYFSSAETLIARLGRFFTWNKPEATMS